MRSSRTLALYALALIAVSPETRAQECKDCDCYHFPIRESCLKCCGFETGTISAVTDNRLVLSPSIPAGTPSERTFQLTPETKTNARPRKGALATVYYRKQGNVAEEVDLTEALQGLLVPANDPDPPNPCPVEILRGALKVFYGDSVAWTMEKREVFVQSGGKEIVALRRTPKGMAVSANLFSADGKLIARLVDNRFYVNPDNFFRIDRPNDHSLVVYDRQAQKVLDIRFLNPTSIRLLGAFNYPGQPPLIISERQWSVGGMVFTRICSGNVGTNINIGGPSPKH